MLVSKSVCSLLWCFLLPDKSLMLSLIFNFVFPGGEKEENIFVNICPILRQIGRRQKTLLVSVSFQLPSAQNNLFIKVAYIEMAYCATLQNLQNKFSKTK